MTNTIFRLQSHKFSTDNIQTTLVCSKCDEVFSKEFPLDLEGQTIELKTQLTEYLDVTHESNDSHIQLLEKQSLRGGITLRSIRLRMHILENRIQTFHRV